MQLTPRYDGPPLLRMDPPPADLAGPLVAQRRRLADTLAGLTTEQWAAPTRCEGWSVQDVVAHLVTTNQFWALSAGAGRAGTPTRFLATFDPVATPAQLVDAVRHQTPEQVLEQLEATNADLATALADLDEAGWDTVAEAPPGHVTLHALALHALWDAWVHERDILLPLGLSMVEEPAEIGPILRYVAALPSAFTAMTGPATGRAFGVDATAPDDRFVIEAGDTVVVRDGEAPAGAPILRGRAVELVEGLSFRAPLPQPLADEDAWVVGGLAQVFHRA